MLIQFSVRFSLQGEVIVDFETRKMSSDSEMSITNFVRHSENPTNACVSLEV